MVLIMNYNDSIQQLLKTDGALAAAVVDYSSGMLLAGGGTSSIDLEIAAAGNTEVLRAKMKTMKLLDLKDSIDDVLITLGEQYHLLRPVNKQDGLCLYFVLDKSKSNLALARRALVEVEKVIK
jgi:predicted regulator of Ras-like GTPase activity (Roadblock/LC7/MglB family)